ncbi:Uncharacterised protein [Cronobacter sakazakii]|nr:Uncharacterised protein [Cronobacter sakazakii]
MRAPPAIARIMGGSFCLDLLVSDASGEDFAFYDCGDDALGYILACSDLDKVSEYFVIHFFAMRFILCAALFFILDSFFLCQSCRFFFFCFTTNAVGFILSFLSLCFYSFLLLTFGSL